MVGDSLGAAIIIVFLLRARMMMTELSAQALCCSRAFISACKVSWVTSLLDQVSTIVRRPD